MLVLFPGPPRSHMDLTLPFGYGEHYSFFKIIIIIMFSKILTYRKLKPFLRRHEVVEI